MFSADAKLRLSRDGTFILGTGRAKLLELVEEERSIDAAAKRQGMSYRHAWAILRKISEALGQDVVRSERGGSGGGGGTVLTEAGKEILNEYRERSNALRDHLRYGRKPALTVDGVVFRQNDGDDRELLLIRRRNPPFRGMYALPGGFVDYGEKTEEAVVRELKEETGLETSVVSLIGVYSDPGRDPRGHTVSPVYLLEVTGGELGAGDDAEDAGFFPVKDIPELAFDHSDIVADLLKTH